jgi:hypothetical protein
MQDRKREMAKIIECTHRAAEQRERCLGEMAALKAQADREQSQFEGEWQRLGAVIDQDKRHRELLRQRDMEERNRKTQEVRSNLWCLAFIQLVKRVFQSHFAVTDL